MTGRTAGCTPGGGGRGGTEAPARADVPIEVRLAAAGPPPLPRTAWLVIDLHRLVANLATFRRAVPAGVRVEPVIKADAYGHGAVPVARVLDATELARLRTTNTYETVTAMARRLPRVYDAGSELVGVRMLVMGRDR